MYKYRKEAKKIRESRQQFSEKRRCVKAHKRTNEWVVFAKKLAFSRRVTQFQPLRKASFSFTVYNFVFFLLDNRIQFTYAFNITGFVL